jgi:hypothetical protein
LEVQFPARGWDFSPVHQLLASTSLGNLAKGVVRSYIAGSQ